MSRGAGKVLIDVRRGDDPAAVRHFTFAGLATTDAYIAREPHAIEAAVRAIVKTQRALRADPALAREVGRRKFPPYAAGLITLIVKRDAMFYEPAISILPFWWPWWFLSSLFGECNTPTGAKR